MENQLFYGDNLEILREYLPDESVDLIYLDPPFNTQRNFNVFFEDDSGLESFAQVQAFADTWQWNAAAEEMYRKLILRGDTLGSMIEALYPALRRSPMMAYLVMMTPRLIELHRVLKSTGSLYLHCDPTASHYLKILMDMLFGADCFQNEIIWRRSGSHSNVKRYAPIHDVILFYTKHPKKYTWNRPRVPYMRGHVETYFLKDEKGYKTNYYGNVLTGSGIRRGESGKPWRGIDPTAKGRHWAIPGRLIVDSGEDMSELSSHQKLDRLYELGYIRLNEGESWPIYEHYINPSDGVAMSDIWAYQPHTQHTVFGTDKSIDEDVRWLTSDDQERLGYPTQKPVALLKRIIQASSNPGDVVLDPFCGCGTTIDAAQELNRHWIVIDITHLAILHIRHRLQRHGENVAYTVHGIPKDAAGATALAKQDPTGYEFQWWALSLVNAYPVGSKDKTEKKIKKGKKGADQGIDGVISFLDATSTRTRRALVQVKSGEVSSATVRELAGTVEREKAAIGILISLKPIKKTMYAEAAAAGKYDAGLGRTFDKIQLFTVEDLLTGAKRPDIPMYQTTFKKLKPNGNSENGQLDLL